MSKKVVIKAKIVKTIMILKRKRLNKVTPPGRVETTIAVFLIIQIVKANKSTAANLIPAMAIIIAWRSAILNKYIISPITIAIIPRSKDVNEIRNVVIKKIVPKILL